MRGRITLSPALTRVGKRDCLEQLVCSSWPLRVPRSIGFLALLTTLYLQSGYGQALPARTYMQIHASGSFLAVFGLRIGTWKTLVCSVWPSPRSVPFAASHVSLFHRGQDFGTCLGLIWDDERSLPCG